MQTVTVHSTHVSNVIISIVILQEIRPTFCEHYFKYAKEGWSVCSFLTSFLWRIVNAPSLVLHFSN